MFYLSFMPGGPVIRDILIFYTGMCFLAIFFYSIFFVYSKQRNYFFLVLAVLSSVLFKLNTFGVVISFPKAELVFTAFLIFSYCLFASEFIGFRKHLSHSSYKWFVIIIMSIVGFQLFSPFVLSWQEAYTLSMLLFIVCTLYVPALMLYIWIKKHSSQARFLFWAFLPTGVATILGALVEINLLPKVFLVIAPFSSSIFILALIVGMVYYIITLQKEKDEERREKEILIEQQNIVLKRKIEARTRELEQQKERSEELLIKASQKQMTELALQSLRAQLNPHFMFNSLNTIQELILKEDFENAHTYLARFAKLLRMLLENTEEPFTPLQKEIDFLELYLSLEKLRLPDLEFSIVTDPDINKRETLIPNMILQPYIENALWHGLSHKPFDKKLEVRIEKQNGNMVYRVTDNGVGREKSAALKSAYLKKHQSKGTDLLARRFQLLSDEFGSHIQTEVTDVIINGKVDGTNVCIIVPDSLVQNKKNVLHDTHHYN